MSISLKIYHKLPSWARNAAASLRGFYLASWRYDKHTEKIVEDILERDRWSDEQWKSYSEERLSYLLNRAATEVPYYRRSWAERRKDGDRSSWEYLENWPILEKEPIRVNPLDFVADGCKTSRMFQDHTSGTTGTSLNIWLSSRTVKYWYAMSEARWRRWYGVSKDDKWAIFGGQLVTPINQKTPPFWVWNAGLKQLYMSSYHLSPNSIGHYLDAIAKYRVKYILGYPSAIYTIAQQIATSGRNDIKLKVVITNAEPLLDFQRRVISEAFSCPVRETYGMAEMVAAGGECEKGNLHQWSDAGIIETDQTPGHEGEFICTGFINPDMPLIRYRVGDCGILSDDKCDCGRTLPLMEKVEGRRDDILYTRDGRRIGRLDPVFKEDLPIVEAQIIQNSFSEIVVKLVPGMGFTEDTTVGLANRIRERMGDINVEFEKVAHIPRTDRGKFRAVVCNLSDEEKASLL